MFIDLDKFTLMDMLEACVILSVKTFLKGRSLTEF